MIETTPTHTGRCVAGVSDLPKKVPVVSDEDLSGSYHHRLDGRGGLGGDIRKTTIMVRSSRRFENLLFLYII